MLLLASNESDSIDSGRQRSDGIRTVDHATDSVSSLSNEAVVCWWKHHDCHHYLLLLDEAVVGCPQNRCSSFKENAAPTESPMMLHLQHNAATIITVNRSRLQR